MLVVAGTACVRGRRAHAHPGGAHEPTCNEADAVDVGEHHFHQLGHDFLHRRVLVLFFLTPMKREIKE
jgi:hypothetical protein